MNNSLSPTMLFFRYPKGKLAAILSVALIIVSFCLCADARESRRPNIILIYADDQGYSDLGCFGSKLIKTPRIDRMAREGVKLTSFYSAAPVCGPSRAALMTGCYAPAGCRTGRGQELSHHPARERSHDRRGAQGGRLPHHGDRQVASGRQRAAKRSGRTVPRRGLPGILRRIQS